MSDYEKDIIAWTIIFLIGSIVVGFCPWALPLFFICFVGAILTILAGVWALDRILD